MTKDAVDNNPDDPTVISRNFEDPFKRLENIKERLDDRTYFNVTLGNGATDKYLWELYYDLIFIKFILIGLGVWPKVSEPIPPHVAGKVDPIINYIIDQIKKGKLEERKDDEQSRRTTSS